MIQKIDEGVAFVRSRTALQPRVGVILGSGLGDVVESIDVETAIPYGALPGPTYETPAEIRAFRTLGADAVGMSTVPEVMAMSHMNIPVLGISCITNMAAGVFKQKLTHQEVMDTTARVQQAFTALVLGVLEKLGES